MNNKSSWLWLIPFLAFAIGYSVMHFFAGSKELPMPSIVGLPLEQALIMLSEEDISLRIIELKEDSKIASGTILSQSPAAKTKIKKRQTVYCIVAKKPEAQKTPLVIGKNKQEIITILDHRGIHAHYQILDDEAKVDVCFAQSPLAGTTLISPEMLIYLSSGEKKPVICPNYIGKPVSDVIEYLKKNDFEAIIQHTDQVEAGHACTSCRVVDQRPIAGAILTTSNNPAQIQLRVRQ